MSIEFAGKAWYTGSLLVTAKRCNPVTVASSMSSSTTVTMTVTAISQLSGVKMTLCLSVVKALTDEGLSARLTLAVGLEVSTTVYSFVLSVMRYPL